MENSELSAIMEDYLESILKLDREKKHVRVKDIAARMHVKMPTVTSMLENLKGKNLVNHEKYEYVALTRKGRKIAKDVYNRHTVLKKFLTDILIIEPATAEEDACKMEHTVSPVTMEKLVKFVEFIETCPRSGSDWLRRFDQYQKHGRDEALCLQQMRVFEEKFDAEVKKLEDKGE